MGLLDDDDAAPEPEPEAERFAVWPENLAIADLFVDVAETQWRTQILLQGATGMTGVFTSRIVYMGLDYAAVESTLRMRRVPRRKHDEILTGIKVMERAALDEMRKARDD